MGDGEEWGFDRERGKRETVGERGAVDSTPTLKKSYGNGKKTRRRKGLLD